MRSLFPATIASLLIFSGGAAAQQVTLQGYFIALSACEANKKKDRDNPGNIHLELLRAYEMIARNSTPGTHYQIKVPGAPDTEARWVAMNCGAFAPKDSLVVAEGTPTGSGGGGQPSGARSLPPDGIEFVLAASWEPSFCASPAGHKKTECQTQTSGRFDATHFALHGLWPDDLDDKAIFPCYCDRGSPVGCGPNKPDDASVDISQEVLAQLTVVMPGVQSGLQNHEWPKHGSCYEDDRTDADASADPDEYFTEAVALMAGLNASAMQPLFESHIGRSLTRAEIETAFNGAFGPGASDRLTIRCDKSGAISELWINLKGDITSTPDLASLILAAPTTATSNRDASCDGGRVTAVSSN